MLQGLTGVANVSEGREDIMNPMAQELTCVVNVSDGREDIMNPMVQNMVQGYEAAQYEYIWISTSRIKGGKQFLVIIIEIYY